MQYDQIVRETRERMKKAVAHFEDEVRGLRSGRATPALVENVRVEAYGSPMPLKQLASIAVPEPRSLVIKPYDGSLIKEIQRALQKSDLGASPQSDGKVVRIQLPEMSEEQRKKLAQRVKEMGEQAKVALRNIRREQNKRADDSEELTDDDVVRVKEEIQKILKEHEKRIEEIVASKTKEIMET